MALSNIIVKTQYKSLHDDLVQSFYVPLLREGNIYRRAVGFFSSTALSLIVPGLVDFVRNNGKIEIIASPRLSEEDINSVSEGYKRRNEIIEKSLLASLEEEFDELSKNRLNLLANLIAHGVLDIKIATLKSPGIYHEKMGIITDDMGNAVVFSGSMNETKTAIKYNYETVDVFCSWKQVDADRVKEKINSFEIMWKDEDPQLEVTTFPQVKRAIIEKYKNTSYEEALAIVEKEHIVCETLAEYNYNVCRIPPYVKLHDYQIDAIDTWENNNYRGIFDMATGTGKTYTGLGAVARLSEALDDKLAVIICCPYQHLVEQWVEDIVKFNINPIVGYGDSKQKDWKDKLKNAVLDHKLKVRKRAFFCFITTNATFAKDFVQEQIRKIKGDALLLVDEAHNFGANNLRRLMIDKFNFRLALSATLDRHGDPEGTQALYDFFGKKCIEYDLERAIDEGKLTPYKYYPVIVSLSDAERAIYDELTQQISKCLIKGRNGKVRLNEKGKKLAIKRARTVAGAIAKVSALEEHIQPYRDDKYILVYCGATNVLDDDKDYTDTDVDDIRQIDMVTDLLGNQLKMKVSQFTSREDVEERETLKREFAKGDNLQALIAIKCLDEGVNIPKIKVAFILASTTNPKEYIQRRGRVLRLAEGKQFAEIYDFITLPRPLDEVPTLTEGQMNRELGLVTNELSRAEEFARIAMNKVSAIARIDEIKEIYNISDNTSVYEGE